MSSLDRDGFCVTPAVLEDARLGELRALLAVEHGAPVAGRRDLLELPFIRGLARDPAIRALVEPVLGAGCFAVRGLFFDKTAGANWLVPRHQDLSIAVSTRREIAGFGPWSEKNGVPHVQPPRQCLEEMVSVRLHLDACDESNGALRVVAGSHQSGKLGADKIADWFESRGETLVPVPSGGAMLFRPLLIHASSPARSPLHRRVVHLEFAARELPGMLEWKWNV